MELNKIADRIRGIQCPAGEVEKKVESLFMDLGFRKGDYVVERKEELNRDGMEAYAAHPARGGKEGIIFYVEEGSDHYVAVVKNAYVQ